jgi:transforming growth factor-beta-induced protein
MADVSSDNGIVHVIDNVVLPAETVVDVALDNGFTTLATAVIKAELIPALSDPFAAYTVFAPTNDAFENLVMELGIDIPGLLELPILSDVLTYHVLGSEVSAADITNGDVVNPLSMTNSLKFTKTTMGEVYVNQAQVTMPDVSADNGIVHVIDNVVLPAETVVDVALDNGFTTLASAVIKAELIPALSDPFSEFTVFAPTNDAFEDLLMELGIDIAGLLDLSNLSDILLYHVVSGTVLSTELMDGDVPTLNGQSVSIDLSNGVMVNDASVITPDVTADNGVVHIIDAVLLPNITSTENIDADTGFNTYPNPTVDYLKVQGFEDNNYQIIDFKGSIVKQGHLSREKIDVANLNNGTYFIRVLTDSSVLHSQFIKM